MISINNISVLFGGYTLLDNVSFLINKKDRIGLTGRNGAGKSTLLKMLAGVTQPTSGNITVPNDVRIGYLPQTKVYTNGTTVREEAKKAFDDLFSLRQEVEKLTTELGERTDYESSAYLKLVDRLTLLNEQLAIRGENNVDKELEVVLKGLGFKQADFERQCEEFSGGWRMRIELAKILLAKPDIFLLDEPTNHLDIESIGWLEQFLQQYSGAVVLVSHDRAFLDNITKRTVEIALGKVYDYKVNYTSFLTLREERIEQQKRAYENQQKQIKDTEDFIERFRYKATKSVQVQSRIKQLDKIDRIEIEEYDASGINIRFQPAQRSGDIVVESKNASKAYGSLQVLEEVELQILRGEKVAFVGKNGEGKSTMVKMIMNQISYDGDLKTGHNVKIGYFAQNQADLLDPNETILDSVDRIAQGEIRKKMRDLLGAFMFQGEDVDKKIGVLSGGERTRLAMVQLLLESYNVLILDEPTNHLDLRTKDILKEALRNFEGTVIVVSHDRDFLNGLADKVFEFTNKKTKEYLGGIQQFLEAKQIETFAEYEKVAPVKNESLENLVVSETKMSFEERKSLNKEIKKTEKLIEQAESQIAKLENEIAEYEEKMSNGESSDDILKAYSKAQATLEEVMLQWEDAQVSLEEWINKRDQL